MIQCNQHVYLDDAGDFYFWIYQKIFARKKKLGHFEKSFRTGMGVKTPIPGSVIHLRVFFKGGRHAGQSRYRFCFCFISMNSAPQNLHLSKLFFACSKIRVPVAWRVLNTRCREILTSKTMKNQ